MLRQQHLLSFFLLFACQRRKSNRNSLCYLPLHVYYSLLADCTRIPPTLTAAAQLACSRRSHRHRRLQSPQPPDLHRANVHPARIALSYGISSLVLVASFLQSSSDCDGEGAYADNAEDGGAGGDACVLPDAPPAVVVAIGAYICAQGRGRRMRGKEEG